MSRELTTGFKWDQYGNLISVTDPSGAETTASYDLARRVSEIVKLPNNAAYRQTLRYEYDGNGRPRKLKQALSEDAGGVPDAWLITEVEYGANGRASKVIDPSGDETQFTYDARRWLSSVLDGENNETKYFYYVTGEMYCERRGVGTPLEQTYKRLAYDLTGQVSQYFQAKSDPDVDCNVAEHKSNDPDEDLYWTYLATTRGLLHL